MALAMPTTIIGNDINWFPLSENILPILSFIYHGFMIFTSIYLLKSHIYNFMISDYKNVVIIAIIFALMAITMNNLLDKDFMMLNRGTGSPFQFLIEISKPLYISTMVGLALILIGLDFVITDAIVNPRRVSDKVKAH
jgi:tellurite resistance protein TehA-like permease